MRQFPSAIVAAITVMSSCTVLENRQECPCDVTVMTDGFVHEGHEGNLTLSVFVNQMSLKTLLRMPVGLDDFLTGTTVVQVPKGWFSVSVVGGTADKMKYDRDTLLLIPPGEQCDSVCAFSKDCFAYTGDDDMVVEGSLNKQFCTAFISVRDSDGRDLDAKLRIRGDCDGFNIRSLEPHAGVFVYDMVRSDSGVFAARIPRQLTSSLELDVELSGNASETVPIGEIMDGAGYSWGTLSLKDVNVDLVYGELGFQVSVREWERKEIRI